MVFKQFWSLFLHCGLEILSIGWRNTIPCLRFTPERERGETEGEGGEMGVRMGEICAGENGREEEEGRDIEKIKIKMVEKVPSTHTN